MKIVLVRHGKAEKGGAGLADEKRALTSNGVRELRKFLPLLQENLSKFGKTVVVWSSPLLRAKQTAAIIAELPEVSGVSYCDFIANGNFEAFIAAAAELPTETILLIVGHEPYLSKWAEKFSGHDLVFRKGMAVGISVVTLVPPRGKLEWLVEPE